MNNNTFMKNKREKGGMLDVQSEETAFLYYDLDSNDDIILPAVGVNKGKRWGFNSYITL